MLDESHTLREAADAYRRRRRRHPPPGFDVWYQYAKDNGAIIVEEFFDQIYHDLNPFWGINPRSIREHAASMALNHNLQNGISVRNGRARSNGDSFFISRWRDLIETIQHLLPDMDIPLNDSDSPRLIVPWERIKNLIGKADLTVKVNSARVNVTEFQSLPSPESEAQLQLLWEYDSESFAQETL